MMMMMMIMTMLMILHTEPCDLSAARHVCWWGHMFRRVSCGTTRLYSDHGTLHGEVVPHPKRDPSLALDWGTLKHHMHRLLWMF